MLYYINEPVKLNRTYIYKGVLMAEFEINGEVFYKERALLTESPLFETIDAKDLKAVGSAGKVSSGSVFIKDPAIGDVKAVPIGELYTGKAEAVPAVLKTVDVIDSINNSEEGSVNTSAAVDLKTVNLDKVEDDKMNILPTENEPKIITATKVAKNITTKIGELDSDQFNKFLAKNKLSKDAVLAVLDGKQRTNKGFNFTY